MSRRANAKRKTRDARRHRYVNNYVRFPNVRAFNDSFYGEPDRLPFYKRKGFYVSGLLLSSLSSLSSPYPLTLAEIRRNHSRRKTKIPFTLSAGLFDGRFYNPSISNVVASAPGREHGGFVPSGLFWHQLGFSDSRKVLTCVRRTVRKQVLHALGKTGKSGQKKPKWNETSYIHC